MNRQELFGGNIVSNQIELDTSYLPLIKSVRRTLSDVTFPRFFSGWPYFILILAALLVGSTTVSSRGLENRELAQSLERTIASTGSFLQQKPQFSFGSTAEYQNSNRCEVNSEEYASVMSSPPKRSWCSTEPHQANILK